MSVALTQASTRAVLTQSPYPTLRPPVTRPDKITLNLVINGTGTVLIDDIVLSKEPLK
jgi:hypothetical protein